MIKNLFFKNFCITDEYLSVIFYESAVIINCIFSCKFNFLLNNNVYLCLWAVKVETSHAQISAIFLQLIVWITDKKSTVTQKYGIKAWWLQLYCTFKCPGGYLSFYQFNCLSISLYAFLSVCLFASQSIFLSVWHGCQQSCFYLSSLKIISQLK